MLGAGLAKESWGVLCLLRNLFRSADADKSVAASSYNPSSQTRSCMFAMSARLEWCFQFRAKELYTMKGASSTSEAPRPGPSVAADYRESIHG